jgi:hypothetical protein
MLSKCGELVQFGVERAILGRNVTYKLCFEPKIDQACFVVLLAAFYFSAVFIGLFPFWTNRPTEHGILI